MSTNNLTTESVSKLFFRYLIPAIMGTMVTSIYVLADTIIIGKGIGIDAMAALNIVLPLFNIFFGNGLLFGVGQQPAVLMVTHNRELYKRYPGRVLICEDGGVREMEQEIDFEI